MTESNLPAPSHSGAHQGNLLNAAVRRDIADLNRLFLSHALDPVHRNDGWFQLPTATIQQFESAPPDALERAAWMPIALFELSLPDVDEPCGWSSNAVGDADRHPDEHVRAGVRRSFGLVALGVVRRLAEGVPFASRIAFGLAAATESRLSGLSPSESFRMASWHGLVRPRWPGHTRFWGMLIRAAAGSRSDDLNWAYSAGLCLLGQCERERPVLRCSGEPRRPRPRHRRSGSKKSDVPC
jgi:hypothetical protein